MLDKNWFFIRDIAIGGLLAGWSLLSVFLGNEVLQLTPLGGALYFPIYACVKLASFTLVPLFAAVTLVMLPFSLLSRKPVVIKSMLILFVSLVVALPSPWLQFPARKACCQFLVWRTRPLVNAISNYEKDLGRPPEKLSMLVPRYLPFIPNSLWGVYQDYEYKVNPYFGEALNPRPRWELNVLCCIHPFNWDCFFYWPTQNYPGFIYGGWTERIDDWAYVHE